MHAQKIRSARCAFGCVCVIIVCSFMFLFDVAELVGVVEVFNAWNMTYM